MAKKDIPNILNMVPAEQDNTRVGGLMEDVEVPGGEFADFDLIKQVMIEQGWPEGIINDYFEEAKKDPKKHEERTNRMTQRMDEIEKNDPEAFKVLESIMGQDNGKD